jgi:hypothetical protein
VRSTRAILTPPFGRGIAIMFAIVLLAFVAGMCCGTIAIGLAMAARD